MRTCSPVMTSFTMHVIHCTFSIIILLCISSCGLISSSCQETYYSDLPFVPYYITAVSCCATPGFISLKRANGSLETEGAALGTNT